MQGGTISPLLANVALHGMEELLVQRFPTKLHKRFYAPQVIRYADDLVVLHKDRAIIEQCQEVLAEWLQNMGLELKPSKTRITHTRNAPVGEPGFSFLGFNIRQYPVGKTQSGKDTSGTKSWLQALHQTKQEFDKETHPPTRSNRWPTSTQGADAANQGAELVDYRLV